MASISISVDDTAVRQLLARAPGRVANAMRAAMNDATALLLRDLQTYPPQRSGSTYARTGTLRRSWSREISGDGMLITGIVGSNENIAPYNRQVQDSTRQAPVHRGRWTNTVQEVVNRNESAIMQMFQARIDAELGT